MRKTYKVIGYKVIGIMTSNYLTFKFIDKLLNKEIHTSEMFHRKVPDFRKKLVVCNHEIPFFDCILTIYYIYMHSNTKINVIYLPNTYDIFKYYAKKLKPVNFIPTKGSIKQIKAALDREETVVIFVRQFSKARDKFISNIDYMLEGRAYQTVMLTFDYNYGTVKEIENMSLLKKLKQKKFAQPMNYYIKMMLANQSLRFYFSVSAVLYTADEIKANIDFLKKTNIYDYLMRVKNSNHPWNRYQYDNYVQFKFANKVLRLLNYYRGP